MTIALRFALVAGMAVATTACGDKTADSTTAAPADTTAAATPAATATAAPATAASPAGQDWTTVVAATPEGGFRMGNPNAPVKLVEFASLTCPHCQEFHEAGQPTIKDKYVATGKISYEYPQLRAERPGLCRLDAGALPGRQRCSSTCSTRFLPISRCGPSRSPSMSEDDQAAGRPAEDQQIAALAVSAGSTVSCGPAACHVPSSTSAWPTRRFEQLTRMRTEAVKSTS